MFIVISPQNPDPLYQQVCDQFIDAITEGTLKPGEKLPSIREISRELKISEITIKRAYSDLENEKYIFTRAGMGSFVADINTDKLKEDKMSQLKDDLIKLIKSYEKFGVTKKNIKDILSKVLED